MIDIETEQRKDIELRRQVRRINVILLLVVGLLIAGPIGLTWWVGRQYPSVSSVRITDEQILGPSALCPGDALTISYTLHAQGAGVLVKDFTTYRVTPPKTVIYSPWHRFIEIGPSEESHIDVWKVPTVLASFSIGDVITYADVAAIGEIMFGEGADGEALPLPPGDYERRIAISSPTNSRAIAIIALPFEIKEGCL